MAFPRTIRRRGIAWALPAMVSMALAADAARAGVDPVERRLESLHPDFHVFVGAVRPLEAGDRPGTLYMALVRPGANDPVARASAPLAGAGARNDILYDPAVIQGARSGGFVDLLVDHEYFHARHLAGATALPFPRGEADEVERHFLEAAAWGYTVDQARAGRYAGLREEEFREALDRYGDHFRALRRLVRDDAPGIWEALGKPLEEPAGFLTIAASRPPAGRARPSGSDRAPATASDNPPPAPAGGPEGRLAPGR